VSRHPNGHAVRAWHDLRYLSDHGQKGHFESRGCKQDRRELRQAWAVVTFDDAKTSVQKLTKATEDAGYPSSVKR
jgi:copper chaperone CopZ